MDSHRKALAKTVTWRLLGVTITTSVVWVITGDLAWAGSVGVVDTLFKLGSYYLHERLWTRVDFGPAPTPGVSTWPYKRRTAHGVRYLRSRRREEVGGGA